MRNESKSSSRESRPISSDSGSEGSRNAIQEELVEASTSYWSGEYVRTVRTPSFNEFWTRAQKLSGKAPGGGENVSISSTPPSLTLLADSLLEPDQAAVDAMLHDSENWKKLLILDLVSDFIDSSLKASSLCDTLLRSVEQARRDRTTMKATLAVLSCSGELDDDTQQQVIERLCEHAEFDNPFSEPASQQFQSVQDCCRNLHRRLEENRRAVEKKIRVLKVCRFIATLLAIVPIKKCLCSCRQFQMSLLRRRSALLDIAARGAYTVNRILETMTCLVTRLHDEVENMKALIRFGWQHRDVFASVQEVTKQLTKNLRNVRLQLKELKEYVYQCFMTINRARSLVVQEILQRTL